LTGAAAPIDHIRMRQAKIKVKPATAARWPDLEELFGPSGAYSGCWCMFLRVSSKTFAGNCPDGGLANKALLKALVENGEEPGLLAYRGKRPVGWVAMAPREQYSRILRSPVHKPVDAELGVWSISCFFVAKGERGCGVADALLTAAIDRASRRGVRMLEAYPVAAGRVRKESAAVWRGALTQFERAGFEVVARRRPARPIVRLRLD